MLKLEQLIILLSVVVQEFLLPHLKVPNLPTFTPKSQPSSVKNAILFDKSVVYCYSEYVYSCVPNKHAARLLIFVIKFLPTWSMSSYMFIDF